MKKRVTKLLSAFLAVLMVVLVLPTQITAMETPEVDSGTCGKNTFYDFYLNEGMLIIQGEGEIEYAPWSGSRAVKYVDIPDGITSICDGAFAGCRISHVYIPDSVEYIGADAFRGCSQLEYIDVSEDNLNYSSIDGNLYNKDATILLQYASAITETSFTLPSSVREIASGAFDGCKNLISILFEDNCQLRSIGIQAFSYCDNLTSFVIPEGVTHIEESTFYSCNKLASIAISNSVTSISSLAFYSCVSLTSITVDANNPNYCSIDGNLYNKNATTLIQYAIGKTDTSFTIPDSVTSIGDYAFYWRSSLTSITIPDSVTSIGSYAFDGCNSLTSITIPDSVTSIGTWAFSSCSSLTSVTIGDSVTSIGDYAFYRCSSLTSITIPDSVTSIGGHAFSWCDSLTNINIPDSVTSIGDDAFKWCSSLTYTIYNNGKYLGNDTNPYVVLMDITNTAITDFQILDCTNIIYDFAFESCSFLKNITIPNGVTSIGSCAFCFCVSLTSITIPNGVTSIGSYAFQNCSFLERIVYYGTENDWNAIVKGDVWDSNAGVSAELGTYTIQYLTYGDATDDGIVNLEDAVLIKEYLANYNYTIGYSPIYVAPGADANGDGKIELADAVLLALYLANFDYETGSSTVVLGPQNS